MKFLPPILIGALLGLGLGSFINLFLPKPPMVTSTPTTEHFEAHCPAPCYAQINDAPVKIRTNKTEKILNGTKDLLTVWLACPRCGRTNAFESEIINETPRATHVLKPVIPRREIQAPIPPLPTGAPVIMPQGYHLELIKDKP